jgi:hypothetical protein
MDDGRDTGPAGGRGGTSTPAAGEWTLVVPVKRLDAAKSRLGGLAGPWRPELALALARGAA